MKFLLPLVELGVSEEAANIYRDIYEIGPWATTLERDAWENGLYTLLIDMQSTHPAEEVRTLVELQAVRIQAIVTGNVSAHEAAIEGLTEYFTLRIPQPALAEA